MSTTLTIRSVDPEVKTLLRVRAAEHGRSMEEEVRQILRDAVLPPVTAPRLGTVIRRRFADLGGVDLDPPDRSGPVRDVDLG